MPKEFHIPNTHLPSEEWFNWQGHRIHLDCYRNPNAKSKVILFHGVGTNGRQMQMVLGYFWQHKVLKPSPLICQLMA